MHFEMSARAMLHFDEMHSEAVVGLSGGVGLNRIARGWQTPAFACQGEDTMFSDADADDDDSDQVISVLITRKHGAAMY